MPSTTKSKRKPAVQTTSKTPPRKTSRKSRGASESGFTEITNYTTALKWLHEHIDHERQRTVNYDEKTFSLSRMRKLLGLLNDPHEQLRCVHVAGTKGKGSTCHMVASMLQATGHATGLFTSPHLIDLRERITINGQMISYNDCADVFRQISEVEETFISSGSSKLTFFEILTAAAFLYFAEQAVDVVVLETGLGGRLDCTNVCTPLVTAITQISLDHTTILGDSLEAIAKEKAGILKPGVPALTIAQEPEVAAVLAQAAEEIGTTLHTTGKDIDFSYRFEANRELGPHTRVCLTTDQSRFEHLPVPLKGEHQALNCGLALAVLDQLKHHGFNLPEDKVIQGLADTEVHGRMEQVWTQPRVIIDGAHNPASIQALIRSLGAHLNYDSCVMIFGCAQDKDVDAMLQQVALGADKVIFTRAKGNPRACEVADLRKQFEAMSPKMAQSADKLEDAVKLAARAVSREDLIVICGSFYLAGEARKFFQDHAAKSAKKK